MSVLIPLFALLALGLAFKHFHLLGDDFWPQADRLTYWVFFPALLVGELSITRFSDFPVLPIVGSLVTAVVVLSGLLLFLRPWLAPSGKTFAPLYQSSIRPNLYIGIAAAMAIDFSNGLPLAAIAIATFIPLVNLLTAPVSILLDDNDKRGLASFLVDIIKNPLFLACVMGIGINTAGITIPDPLYSIIHLLGLAAVPLGMLSIGAGLDIQSIPRALTFPFIVASCAKLLLLPILAYLTCSLYSVPPLLAVIPVLFAALPAPANAIHPARPKTGGSPLAALFTLQTLLAIATLPLILHFIA